MGLVSNSHNPKIILVEQGSTPATPDTGEHKLFVRSSDGHLCRVDDAAAVTDIESVAAAGNVVQVVNTQTGAVTTGTTTIPFDDTIPQNTEGNEVMTLAITPTSSTNTLRIEVLAFLSNSAIQRYEIAALFQDSATNALAAGAEYSDTSGEICAVHFVHTMTAGTTSATTFKVRAGGHGAGTMTFNGTASARKLGGVMASSLTITEIQV